MQFKTWVWSLTFFVLGLCAKYSLAEDFDWPRWRGPHGDGISLETDWDPYALAGGPKILWKADVGIGYSNIAIKNNRLYTMGKGEVYCLNAETGEEIWRYTDEKIFEPRATPTIDDAFVYTLSKEGALLCLRAKNGKLRWRKDLREEYDTESIPYGYSGSPVIVSNLIILNVNTAGIALDKKTGNLIWMSPAHTDKVNPNGYHATPVLYDYAGKRCALFYSGTGLSSVELETGNQIWFYEWFSLAIANVADPIVFEKKVYISNISIGKGGVLLDISGGQPEVVWHNKDMKNGICSSVLVDNFLFGFNGPDARYDALKCVEWKTGEILWKKEMRGGSLISANGKLIILDADGILRIAEATPTSYQEISSCDVLEGEKTGRVFWTPPVLCNGKIYCRNYARDLICIDVSK